VLVGGALTSYRISVLGLEPLRNHPFEPRLHSNAWATISARETPVLLGISGVVCSIPCDLPYDLRHHVIFGPTKIGRVA
jgi:hypothetical protein